MRIGIDCRTMLDWRREGEAAGIGHYTFYLVKHLLRLDRDNEYVLFIERTIPKRIRREILGDNEHVEVRHFPFQSFKACLPFVYSHMVISSIFERANLDILHSPANSLPMFYRRRSVVTVHDLAIYDHPEWFPSQHPGALSFSERILVPYSVRKATRLIAVSKQTKADLMRQFSDLNADKIDVVYEGAETSGSDVAAMDEKGFLELGLTPQRYFLFLSTIEPRKNLPAACRAFVRFARKHPTEFHDFDFVVAGRRGWKSDASFAAIADANSDLSDLAKEHNLPVRERVRYVGYLPHDVKPLVMQRATAFVFPTFYEGFGLPVIEAMSLGTPVITSKRASLPEICADAAEFVDPDDDTSIVLALEKLALSPDVAKDLGKRGWLRAQNFSWDKVAMETVEVYRRAMTIT